MQLFALIFYLNFSESGFEGNFAPTKPIKMNTDDLLKKPIWQMTGEEFLSLSNFQNDKNNAKNPKVSQSDSHKKFVYGIRGIANLLDCSIATANRIKKSGVIDEAIFQHNRKIVVDSEKALHLFRTSAEHSKTEM